MIYTAAQREDGTPVPVTEHYDPTNGRRIEPSEGWPTRPVSWALILPGDTVLIDPHDVTPSTVYLVSSDLIEVIDPYGCEIAVPASRLTLVCTDEIPEHRGNPAWGWDS